MTFPSLTLASAAALAAAIASASVAAAPAADQLARYAAEAGRAPVPAQGRAFFADPHGREWSCASCHGQVPVQAGRHAGTGKAIEPLAPAAHAARFTDAARTEKWFRRNCNDVLGRECTAGEKADVLAWLVTLKP